MADLAEDQIEESARGKKGREPTASRTVVIVLSEVVVIVALLVLWSILRRRGSNA